MTQPQSIAERVRAAAEKHLPHGNRARAYLVPLLTAFAESGVADVHFLSEIEGNDIGQFWSRTWEAILFNRFARLGWAVTGAGAGPDFLVRASQRETYVEATVPSADGLPPAWLADGPHVRSMPHEQMVLRWTNAIDAKQKKHLADIQSARARSDIPFVIAVNSVRLSRTTEELGISQWPFAVEAVFPIGPFAVSINRDTLESGAPFQSTRFGIKKPSGVEIPTYAFLDPAYAHVSAVLGCATVYAGEDTPAHFLGFPPMVVVHNPLAANPLPLKWLPASLEYIATPANDEEFTLMDRGRVE